MNINAKKQYCSSLCKLIVKLALAKMYIDMLGFRNIIKNFLWFCHDRGISRCCNKKKQLIPSLPAHCRTLTTNWASNSRSSTCPARRGRCSTTRTSSSAYSTASSSHSSSSSSPTERSCRPWGRTEKPPLTTSLSLLSRPRRWSSRSTCRLVIHRKQLGESRFKTIRWEHVCMLVFS